MKEVRAKGLLIFPETKLPDNSLIERFDFFGNFEKISEEDKQNVLKSLNVNVKYFENNRVSLVLGSGLNTMYVTAFYYKYVLCDYMYMDTKEKYETVYTLICDYLYDKGYPIVFKPHPGCYDIKLDSLERHGVFQLINFMPVEYLNYMSGLEIKYIAYLEGSSEMKLGKGSIDCSLGWGFLGAFFFINKIYVMVKIIIDCALWKSVLFYGIPDKVCEGLNNLCFENSSDVSFTQMHVLNMFEPRKCYMISSLLTMHEPISERQELVKMLCDAPNDCVVFFTNSLFEYCFVDIENREILDYIIPVVIQKEAIVDEPLVDVYDEVFYVFTKDTETATKIKLFTCKKTLKYSGIEFAVEPISQDRLELERRKGYETAVFFAAQGICCKGNQMKEKQENVAISTEAMKEIEHWKLMATQVQERVRDIEKSRSWRITGPLRYIMDKLRKAL